MAEARRSLRPRGLAAALLGLAIVAGETASAQGRVEAPRSIGPQRVEVAEYQALLDEYLVVKRIAATSGPSRTVVTTMFDYDRLRGSGGDLSWRSRLDRVRRQIFSVEPSRLAPKDLLAWAINAYNFLVVSRVVEELIAADSAQTRIASVRDIPRFFTSPVITIEGSSYSLDEFERAFVFGGTPRDGAVPVADPRPYFALTGAARGGPFLPSFAFRPATLEPQLDVAVRQALAHPAHLRWDPATQALELSPVFEWHAKDFGGPSGILSFVRNHAPSHVRRALRSRATVETRTLPWSSHLDRP